MARPDTPDAPFNDSPLLDLDAVSSYVRLSPQAVLAQARRPRAVAVPFPRGFRVGRKRMWRKTDVDAWIDAMAATQEQR